MGVSTRRLLAAGVSSFALGLGGHAAQAAEAPATGAITAAAETTELDQVIVTGTRVTGMKAVDSPAPIQILGADVLKRVGQTDLIQAMAQNIPSYTAQAFGNDTSAFTLSAKLRGVSPNHALVLVNGKRRHPTANISIAGNSFTGAAGADLSLIPVASIDHVEVLQDGAAAQYGSDAIAGVVNIIQKTNGSGGSLSATGGRYIDQGGVTGDVSGNIGLQPFDKAYLNLTGEMKYHGFSFRGVTDPRTINTPYNVGAANSPAKSYPQIINAPNYPYLNRISGDALYQLYTVAYNAGYEVSENLEIYTFGSYGRKHALSNQNYRLPNVVKGVSATDIPFPLGFEPREELHEHDFQISAGARGEIGGWHWDLASNWGKDFNIIHVDNTANADLYKDTSTLTTKGSSPNHILAGKFQAGQWENTLDLTHDFEVGLATPLTFAVGGEYREDYYAIKQGEPATYYKGGSQSFFGFSPANASSNKRHNTAVYMDLAVSPVEQWKVDAAVRYADFSDFGDTTVYKLTSRYDFNDTIAIRGTASTGFRAPSLAEGFYSGINVSPSSISGQLAPNSAGAKLLGINGLKPEKSTNYSVGFVAHPIPAMTVTFDAYQIKIEDRIVGSGTLYGDASNKALIRSPAVLAALTANGINIDSSIYSNSSWSIGVSLFANGLDTRTRGADLVMNYASDFDSFGHVDWTAAANYNETKVTKIAPPPAQLAPGAVLYDVASIASLETSAPKYKVVLGAFWTLDKWSVNLKETGYGKSISKVLDSFGTPTYRDNVVKPALITDLEVAYSPQDGVKVAIGANNLFNIYPDRTNGVYRQHLLQQNSSGYAVQYPSVSAFGINGGFYYARVTYNF
jgi:iron complex outermembrane receptor protein